MKYIIILILILIIIILNLNNNIELELFINGPSIGIKPNTFGDYFTNKIFNYNKIKYIRELDIINDINNYKIDYGIITLETYSYFKSKTKKNNINFIASLAYSYVNLLAKNNININLIYNHKYKNIYKINVLYKNSVHHLTCKKLLNYLNIEKYFEFVYINNNFDILCYVGINPNKFINDMLNKQTLHYINIDMLEQKLDFINFYKSYFHDMININDLNKLYPNLTVINRNNPYINTIKTTYILISHNNIYFDKMHDLMEFKHKYKYDNYFKIMNQISLIEMNYNRFNIPFNKGAKDWYYNIKIHSNNFDWNNKIPPKIPPLYRYIGI